jgi:hypothetical protein
MQQLQYLRILCLFVQAHIMDEVLAAANVRITAFWDVTPCSLVVRYRHIQRNMLPSTLKMEAEGFFKEDW